MTKMLTLGIVSENLVRPKLKCFVYRGPSSSDIRQINDVIVNQEKVVQQLNGNGRRENVFCFIPAASMVSQRHKSCANPLSATDGKIKDFFSKNLPNSVTFCKFTKLLIKIPIEVGFKNRLEFLKILPSFFYRFHFVASFFLVWFVSESQDLFSFQSQELILAY